MERQNPFSPGPGSKPAHIVGRPQEREFIVEALHTTLADRDMDGLLPLTSSPQVIVGLRGVGKTTLLYQAYEWAVDAGIHVVELDEDLLTGAGENLMQAITPLGRLDMFNRFLVHHKGPIRYLEQFNFEIGPSGKLAPMDLDAALAAGALAGPMAILLDEAHTVPAERMHEFCYAARTLIGDGYPLALVMAGTPELWPMLMERDGPCMEWGTKISFNLFTVGQAQEALSKGFECTGLKVDSGALESLVEWSDRYPYFIQLAGHWTWEQAESCGADTVSLEIAKSGLELAGEERGLFHRLRHNELMNHRVLNEALQVVELMSERPEGLDRVELLGGLRVANDGMDGEGAMEVERKLVNLGFIHDGKETMEAGIPSLFDHIRSRPGMDGRIQ